MQIKLYDYDIKFYLWFVQTFLEIFLIQLFYESLISIVHSNDEVTSGFTLRWLFFFTLIYLWSLLEELC